jgi:hypothetical protein
MWALSTARLQGPRTPRGSTEKPFKTPGIKLRRAPKRLARAVAMTRTERGPRTIPSPLWPRTSGGQNPWPWTSGGPWPRTSRARSPYDYPPRLGQGPPGAKVLGNTHWKRWGQDPQRVKTYRYRYIFDCPEPGANWGPLSSPRLACLSTWPCRGSAPFFHFCRGQGGRREIVDRWGLGGPVRLENSSNCWAAKRPTSWMSFLAGWGRPDPRK